MHTEWPRTQGWHTIETHSPLVLNLESNLVTMIPESTWGSGPKCIDCSSNALALKKLVRKVVIDEVSSFDVPTLAKRTLKQSESMIAISSGHKSTLILRHS